jgi:putative methyltransferase
MGGLGTISAFERSENRFNTLSKRIDLQGASDFVTPIMRDFMTVDTSVEFPDVSHILIDPSCSGSGLVLAAHRGETTPELGGVEAEHDEETRNSSVEALALEQQALILHAMSLPSARVIAFSTCSIHRVENEDVVVAVLAERKDWHLVEAVPQWPHRGLDLPDFADIKDKVCRADFEKDGTNGFFVARFERSIVATAAGVEVALSKKERKKQRKSKRDDDDKDDPLKKKSSKKGSKRKAKGSSDEDDDNDVAVANKLAKKAKKKKSKERVNETVEERRERKANKKKKKK